jgi:hypothetical protein
MSEREQLSQVCRWNRTLASENARLRAQLHHALRQCRQLRAANVRLGAERDTASIFMGEAMDAALEGGRP